MDYIIGLIQSKLRKKVFKFTLWVYILTHSSKNKGLNMAKCKENAIIDLVTAAEFAKMIGVSYPTFAKFKKTKGFPKGIVLGNYMLWRKELVLEFIKNLGM